MSTRSAAGTLRTGNVRRAAYQGWWRGFPRGGPIDRRPRSASPIPAHRMVGFFIAFLGILDRVLPTRAVAGSEGDGLLVGRGWDTASSPRGAGEGAALSRVQWVAVGAAA